MLDKSAGYLTSLLFRRTALTGLMVIAPLLLLLCGLEISQRLWRPLAQMAGPVSFGGAALKHTIMALAQFLFLVVPLIVIETLFPTSRPSMRSYAIGIAGWSLAWALGYIVGLATQALTGHLGVTPLVVVKVSAYSSIVALALVFLNMFIFDFFYYWFHRLQHAIPGLWRFHAVHHSIKELNSVMSFHHPLEDLIRIIPIALPLALLVRFEEMPVIPIVSAFFSAWGYFIHMDSRVNFGPGRMFLTDGHYHRIHHSEREEHHNRNFAAFFPFWDWFFGTVHMPARDEYPTVGLPVRPNGVTVRDYFFGVPTETRPTAKADH
jgi:sterol desaturase/sphingolipid hydroxylase (fatty acid hydroxylase superfamily)